MGADVMRQGSERVLLVTNQNPQTTIFVDFITEQITRIVSVTAPRDYLDTPSGETTVVLLDADHLGEDIMQEWHKKLADTPSCHLTAFNLRDEDHAASLLTFLHLRGVFYRDDHLLQICKGIDSLFSGNLWMSRSLMTRMIEFFRKQQLNAYRPSCGLTQREIEILGMVSSGASNCEIANQLFLSEYTVKSHLYNVFKKIDVHNRTQAANWARQNIGVLPPLCRH
ncbi:response regulator transcription factor [Halomonas sp. PGE1]|uniref:response regulator transcription factor n=1 Tax=Halomonas sp. PGE1 TaxID=2730360 RepID=UPI002016694E|nr:response regulator transcription factor [Halomonas sp. PGE1]